MHPIATAAAEALEGLAEPHKAGPMAAYMKTEMPFWGVSAPARRKLASALRKRFPSTDDAEHALQIRALWALQHREEKYLAIDLARRPAKRIGAQHMALYEQLIREGQWWDLVDAVATDLVGGALRKAPEEVWPTMDAWIDDEDLWIRRTAILCQNKHRAATDEARLFRYCLRRAPERDFFIRKAIGWALREYAKTAPGAVLAFCQKHGDRLSGLSRREAMKHL